MTIGARVRLAAMLGAAAMLAACAPQAPRVADVPAAARTAAVIVVIPDRLRLMTVGITIFANHLENPAVPDWNLAAMARDTAVGTLAPRFQVVGSQVFTQFVDAEGKPADQPDDAKEIAAFARTHQSGSPADIVVVITNEPGPPLARYPQSPLDIGISKQLLPILPQPPVAYAYSYVTVLDGKTFAVMSESRALTPPAEESYNAIGAEGNLPYSKIEIDPWHDHWQDWSAEQKEMLKNRVYELLATSLRYTLQMELKISGSS